MKKRIAFLLAGAGLVGATALGHLPAKADTPPKAPVIVPVPTPAPVPVVTTPTGGTSSFAPLAKAVGPAVVSIDVRLSRASNFDMDPFGRGGPAQGQGSGFVISPDGYIVTNDHVVGESTQIVVHFADGRELPGKLVGSDERTDIALIKVESKTPLPSLALGDSDKLEVGEWVIAIGNPFGLDHTVTAGIVSAKGRRSLRPNGRSGQYDFIQTDASINPGNSGGPLINIRGEVVGINAAVNMAGQGLGFAIPINMAKTLLPMLKDKGKVARSYLGVKVQDVTGEMARSMGLPSAKGAIVADVVDGSPAAKAGVRAGDVIHSVDGKLVEDASTLTWHISTAGAGKTVKLSLTRKGARQELPVLLEALPEDGVSAPRVGDLGGGKAEGVKRLGVEVQPVTADLAKSLGLDRPRGVVVTSVTGKSGFRSLAKGDVIVAVGDNEIASARELGQLADRVPKGELIRMLVVREGQPMWLAFTLP